MMQMEFIYNRFKYLHYLRPLQDQLDRLQLTDFAETLLWERGRLPLQRGFFCTSSNFLGRFQGHGEITRSSDCLKDKEIVHGAKTIRLSELLSLFLHPDLVQPPWGFD